MTALTHDVARALADAGYMPINEYLDLCRQHGWHTEFGDGCGVDAGAAYGRGWPGGREGADDLTPSAEASPSKQRGK